MSVEQTDQAETSAPAGRIRVVVAEDEDLIRGSLVKKIGKLDPLCQVVGDAHDGKMALEMVGTLQPDLVITDIRMPVMDGIELLRSLHLHNPRIRTIVTSGFAEFEYARQAMQFGVREYLLKPVKSEELQRALAAARLAIENERGQLKADLRELGHSNAEPEEIVRRVQSYMREHFRQELSLEQIARTFNFNASYLSRIFQKYADELPSKYLMTLRINEAKYLLTHHRELSVKEVGERVGYPDQFYFSRVFKQATGCTPKEYAK